MAKLGINTLKNKKITKKIILKKQINNKNIEWEGKKIQKIKLHNFSPILFYSNYNQLAIALKLGYNCSHITLQ